MVGEGLQEQQLAKNMADGMCFPDTRGCHIGVAQPPHHPRPKPLHLTLSFKSPSWVRRWVFFPWHLIVGKGIVGVTTMEFLGASSNLRSCLFLGPMWPQRGRVS